MNPKFKNNIGIMVPEILMPAKNVDLTKWACVACDQYTSQPDYWNKCEEIVGDAPSTLRLMLPEIYLEKPGETEKIAAIRKAMHDYIDNGILQNLGEGFVFTRRSVGGNTRNGLVVALDLECYDYSKGSTTLIRATEGTIVERIPPRLKIRDGALLELPHILVLIDDEKKTVIEPLAEKLQNSEKLYDFELMLGGGRLRGWAVDGADGVLAAMDRLPSLQGDDPILFAVGDGNHSMAAARKCWLEHPTERNRYMLAEVVNLYDESLRFEPIHRLLRGEGLDAVWRKAAERGVQLDGGDVRKVQPFLDETLDSSVQVDYIHGAQALEKLAAQPGCRGIALKAIAKETLFPSLKGGKTLPRKAFSMGEAQEKRYYMEAREI